MRLCCAHPLHQDHLILTLSSMFTVPNLFGAWHQSLQSHHSSTAQLRLHITYSSHSCADIPPLSTTLGLIPIQSLLHLTVYPALMWVLRVPVISFALYCFHRTWFILPGPDLVLSPVIPCLLFRLFTCHCKYSVDYPVFFSLKSTIVTTPVSVCLCLCLRFHLQPLDRNLCKGSTLIVLSCWIQAVTNSSRTNSLSSPLPLSFVHFRLDLTGPPTRVDPDLTLCRQDAIYLKESFLTWYHDNRHSDDTVARDTDHCNLDGLSNSSDNSDCKAPVIVKCICINIPLQWRCNPTKKDLSQPMEEQPNGNYLVLLCSPQNKDIIYQCVVLCPDYPSHRFKNSTVPPSY